MERSSSGTRVARVLAGDVGPVREGWQHGNLRLNHVSMMVSRYFENRVLFDYG